MISVGYALKCLTAVSLVPPVVGAVVGYYASKVVHMHDKQQEKVTRAAVNSFGLFVGIFSGFLVLASGLLALPLDQKV